MTRETFPIERAGWFYIIILTMVTGLCYYFFKPASALSASLLVFTAFFFRNPRRKIPKNSKYILSPADGVVLAVNKANEKQFLEGYAQRVSIFLSILNVHVNRSPIEGEIKLIKYVPGKFLPAFKSHASEINERNYVGIESPVLKVLVCQITGFIARRIVCYARQGDKLEQGQSFGMIKFGSCTEIYMPEGVEVLVRPGDSVKGGETIIGRLADEN